MSYHAYQAKQIFDDAKQYINPQSDPVNWDLINGLSELAEAIRALHSDVDDIKKKLR